MCVLETVLAVQDNSGDHVYLTAVEAPANSKSWSVSCQAQVGKNCLRNLTWRPTH